MEKIEEIVLHYLPLKEYSKVKEILKKQAKELNTLQKENEELREDYEKSVRLNAQGNIRYVELEDENTKLKEALKDIRSQLFDAKNCETILTKSIDVLLKD